MKHSKLADAGDTSPACFFHKPLFSLCEETTTQVAQVMRQWCPLPKCWFPVESRLIWQEREPTCRTALVAGMARAFRLNMTWIWSILRMWEWRDKKHSEKNTKHKNTINAKPITLLHHPSNWVVTLQWIQRGANFTVQLSTQSWVATTADSQICHGSHLRSPSENHGKHWQTRYTRYNHQSLWRYSAISNPELSNQARSFDQPAKLPWNIMKHHETSRLRPGHFMSMMPTLVSSSNPAVFTQASKWDLTTGRTCPKPADRVQRKAGYSISESHFGKFKVSYHVLRTNTLGTKRH